MHPDRGIVITYRWSDDLYTRPEDQKTLTYQSDNKNKPPSVGKPLAGYKNGLPLPVLPRTRSRLPQGIPLNGVPCGGVPSLQVEG